MWASDPVSLRVGSAWFEVVATGSSYSSYPGGTVYLSATSCWDGPGMSPYNRHAVLGLVVIASTLTADLATYDGHLEASRVSLFALAGLFAAAVVLLASDPVKKKISSQRLG